MPSSLVQRIRIGPNAPVELIRSRPSSAGAVFIPLRAVEANPQTCQGANLEVPGGSWNHRFGPRRGVNASEFSARRVDGQRKLYRKKKKRGGGGGACRPCICASLYQRRAGTRKAGFASSDGVSVFGGLVFQKGALLSGFFFLLAGGARAAGCRFPWRPGNARGLGGQSLIEILDIDPFFVAQRVPQTVVPQTRGLDIEFAFQLLIDLPACQSR